MISSFIPSIKRKIFQYICDWDLISEHRKRGIFLCFYTVLFLITFTLSYSPFLLTGKSFLWTTDGRFVHYPTLVYIGRYFRQIILNLIHGKLCVPLFDLCIGTGNDIISTLNYDGFGDPLNLLAIIVPTSFIEYLYNFLVVLRLYLAGLAFSALCIYHHKRISHTLIGSLIYVFSGYAIYCAVRHPYFINPMIQLPMLLIGIELVINKKICTIFIVSVFYSALCGFYFLYMMTIFLGIYTLVRFFELYKVHRIKEFIHMAGCVAGSYFCGISLSAVILIPAIVGFFFSSRSGVTVVRNYLSWGLSYYRNNALKAIAPTAHWNSFGMAAVVLLAVVLLLTVRKKKCCNLKILFIIALLIYIFPFGGYIMNGFGYPSQRWTFGMALLISYIVVDSLPILLNLDRRQSLICFTTLLVYMLCVFVSSQNRNVYHVVGVAMLAITLVVLLLFNNTIFALKKRTNIGVLACMLLTIGNVSINAIYTFDERYGNYIGDFTEYGVETNRLKNVFEREAEPFMKNLDGRFGSTSFTYNANMIWHIPTMYIYQNLSNGNNAELWKTTENIQQLSHTYKIREADQRTIMNTLLSTKYVIEKMNRLHYLPYGYELLHTTESGNYIYENTYALPWGYTYDNYILYDALKKLNGLEVEESMLQTIALDEPVDGFSIASVESNIRTIQYSIKELNNVEWENGILKVKKANAVISLEFQLPSEMEGYLRLQGFDINNSGQEMFNVTVTCGDISKSAVAKSTDNNWYFGRENYLFNLGYSGEERTSCTISFPKKGTYHLDDIQVYALPMDKYPKYVEALRAEPLENIEFGTNRVSGTVDLSQNKILCMSIPYSIGWSAKVDGEPVKVLRGNYMFMAIPLLKGHHEIELIYCTPGLKLGAIISLLSFIGIVVWYISRHRIPERQRRNRP